MIWSPLRIGANPQDLSAACAIDTGLILRGLACSNSCSNPACKWPKKNLYRGAKQRFRQESTVSGREFSEFGTVRPRVQIPGPRPFSYSKSTISNVVWSQLHTSVSQFPAEQRNRGGVTASVAANVRSRDWESVGRQRPKPAQARGSTVRESRAPSAICLSRHGALTPY